MKALLAAELLKLRTTRTFVALALSAVGLSLLTVVLTILLDEGLSGDQIEELFATDFTSLFILLLGVIGMTGEWRHRTITSTILAAPDRLRLLLVKALAYATAGVVLSLLVTVVIMAVGTLLLSMRDEETASLGGLLDVLWRNLLQAAFLGALGIGLGAAIRNQVAAVVGVLVFSLMVEPAIVGLAPDVGRFGPTSGAPSGIAGFEGFGDDDLLAPGAAALVMLGWVCAVLGVAGALLRSRDVT